MIVCIDFETTGLLSQRQDFMAQPGIVQIGAVKLVGANETADEFYGAPPFSEMDSFSSLVNPERSKWEEEAIKTHGIKPEMVQDAPTFFELGPALARFCLGCDVWMGYNCKFDRDVLWWQLMRYGLERSFPWPPGEVDVMVEIAKVMELQGKKGVKNPKLVEAFEYCHAGHSYQGAHDALADVRATADVFRWIKRREADAS